MGTTAYRVILLALLNATLMAQQAPPPQTARQALLEMFFSKTPGTFIKHLPAATLEALQKSGAMANLAQYSMIASQLQANEKNFQIFETGSVLLSGEDPKTGQKVDITVINEVTRGEQDDIELSFQTYKEGKPQRVAFMPHMTFSMKQEAHIWKLNEISVTVRVPLADHDVLTAFTESMQKAHAAAATTNASFTTQSEPVAPTTDPQVLKAMHTILNAQLTYAVSYPNVGFTCTLSELDGFGSGERNEHQAMLIDSGLAAGRKYGYVFAVSGCGPAPARAFQLTATPNANTFGRKTFCADQSNVIRSSDDPAKCLASGTPVQ